MHERKLTVLQALPALDFGGVERGTVELGRELVRRGCRSLVISAGGRLVDRLVREGSEHIAWTIGAKTPWTFRYVSQLRRLLREEQVDILHMRSRMPAWVCWLAWSKMPPGQRPRLISTVHGPYSVNRYSSVMTRGETVIAISRSIVEYLNRNYPGLPSDRIRLIHRGVDPAEYPRGCRPDAAWLKAWHTEYPELAGRSLLTLPARVTRWKGQEDFLQVIAELQSQGRNVHGLIVGGCDPRRAAFVSEIRQKAVVMGIKDRITLTGHRGDLKEIMAVSDVVLSLSREPEAFGRAALEALCLGRPVVAYDHGGVSEQLAAMLPEGAVPVGNVRAAAARAAAWLDRPPVVGAENPFTLQNMLDATIRVYQDLTTLRAAA
ncbi:MAG: glycosyltransferase family 4 protein [Planctomyces sp.]|nr:glycosyltransferase family 4 protein [Planctomyces sp.]